MACIEQKTDFNFLNWNKVVGSYTLADLQASGVPIICDNITPEPQGWNLSTATFLRSLDISSEEAFLTGVFISDDGTRLFIIGSDVDEVNSYILTTPYDISTAYFESVFSTSAQDSLCSGLFFRADGLKMYHTGSQNDKVYEYDLTN